MNKILWALLITVSGSVSAECYMRSDINLSRMQIQGRPTDIQRMVAPDPNGKRCVVRYRVHADGNWRTLEGSAVAQTEAEACGRALDQNNSYALEEITPGRITADNLLVCSDLPDIQVRPVRRGELIWESETDLHSDASQRHIYFNYKQARCRKFIERTALDQNLIIYQGIICQNDTGPNSKWRVIDKY